MCDQLLSNFIFGWVVAFASCLNAETVDNCWPITLSCSLIVIMNHIDPRVSLGVLKLVLHLTRNLKCFTGSMKLSIWVLIHHNISIWLLAYLINDDILILNFIKVWLKCMMDDIVSRRMFHIVQYEKRQPNIKMYQSDDILPFPSFTDPVHCDECVLHGRCINGGIHYVIDLCMFSAAIDWLSK